MKRIWYAAVALLPGLMSAQIITKPDALITFGRLLPTGCDSNQRGSCSVSIMAPDPNVMANGSAVKVNSNSFSVEILRSRLSAQDELDIAGKPLKNIAAGETPVFIMQDNYIVDADSLKIIGIDPKANNTIMGGQYPLSVSADKVKITFLLTPAR